MKPDEIAELEQLLEKSTPGPWRIYGASSKILGPQVGPALYQIVVDGNSMDKTDAGLIVAMRNALPRLLAERRELRALVLETKGNALYRAASLKMATFDDDEGRRLMRYYWLFTRWAKAIREGRR